MRRWYSTSSRRLLRSGSLRVDRRGPVVVVDVHDLVDHRDPSGHRDRGRLEELVLAQAQVGGVADVMTVEQLPVVQVAAVVAGHRLQHRRVGHVCSGDGQLLVARERLRWVTRVAAPVQPAHSHGAAGTPGSCQQPLQRPRRKLVVGVQAGDVLTGGRLDAGVPGSADATIVRQLDHPNARVGQREAVQNLDRGVRRAVVDADQLQGLQRLGQGRAHAQRQEGRGVVDRHHHGHHRPRCTHHEPAAGAPSTARRNRWFSSRSD